MPALAQNIDSPYASVGNATPSDSRGWSGVDLHTPQPDTAPQTLLVGDNLINVAGYLQTRPGIQGMLSSPLTTARYHLCTFVDMKPGSPTIGSTFSIVTQGGKLYKVQQGASTQTELLDVNGDSYNFNSATTLCEVFGSYAYPVDGAHATLRLDLTGGYPTYAMIAPVQAPTITLNSIVVDSFDAADLAAGPTPLSNTTLITNGYFDTGGGASGGGQELVGAPWSLVNGKYGLTGGHSNPDYGPGSSGGTSPENIGGGHPWSLLLDEPSDAIGQTFTPVLNATTSYPNPNGSLTKNACFLLQCEGREEGSATGASLSVQVIAYDSSGYSIAEQDALLTPTNNLGFNTMQAVFNFTEVLSADPDHYELILASGPTNKGGAGVWIAAVQLTPLGAPVMPSLTDASGGQVRWSTPYGAISGSYVEQTFTTPKDFSKVGILGTPITSDLRTITDLYLRFGFVQAGTTAIVWSDALSFDTTASDYAFVDITNIASTVLASVEYLYLQATTDLIPGDVSAGTPINLITFGPLSNSGNLTATEDDAIVYNWYVTETTQISAINLIESNPSAPSLNVSPTEENAEAVIKLPSDCLKNPSTNRLGLYRIGGDWPDVRRIAYVPYAYSANIDSGAMTDLALGSNPAQVTSVSRPFTSADVGHTLFISPSPQSNLTAYVTPGAYGVVSVSGGVATLDFAAGTAGFTGASASFTDPANAYYTWNAGTKTFTDNTPDESLTLAPLMSFSRDPAPVNAQANAVWQDRYWTFVGNQAYASWLGTADNAAALMTTLSNNSQDPNLPIEGATFPIGSDPTNHVVRAIPYGVPIEAGNQFGGGLLCLMQRGDPFLIEGEDASSFTVKPYGYSGAPGLAALHGVTRTSANSIVWMGGDRLRAFPPNLDAQMDAISLPIQPALYPYSPAQATLQSPAAFAQSALGYHDEALYVAAPQPGSTAPDVVWKYDYRNGRGWLRWTGQSVTGFRSMPPSTATGSALELYLMGAGGQEYRVISTVDKQLPTDAGTPITFTATSHGLIAGFFRRYRLIPLHLQDMVMESVWLEVVMGSPEAPEQLTIIGQAMKTNPAGAVAISGKRATLRYNLSGGGTGFRKTFPSGLISGQYTTITLTGTVSDVAIIKEIRPFLAQTAQQV